MVKCPHCGFSWDNDEWDDEDAVEILKKILEELMRLRPQPVYYPLPTTADPQPFYPYTTDELRDWYTTCGSN